MIIELKKIGTSLMSRQNGREAFLGFLPNLKGIPENEDIIIDFDGVDSFSPSWGDEFLTPLQKKYSDRMFLKKTENPSVKATVETLEEFNKTKFNWKD